MQRKQVDSHPPIGLGGLLMGMALGLVFMRRHLTRPDDASGQPVAADVASETAPSVDTGGRASVQVRPGWRAVPHEAMPRPTYWPAILALGVVFLLWGFVTSFIISLVGLALFALALWGWIQELQHEQ